MPTPLPSTPKYVEVADKIEAKILQGTWDGGRMPSVRGVAGEHGVSVVTASRALQVLRDKGLIRTVQRTGCFRVPPPEAERWAVCLRLTPGPWQRATIDVSRTGFEALARRQPMHLEFDAFELTPGLTVAEAAQAAAAARADGVQGVFLLPSRASDADARAEEAFLAGCRQAGLPLILLERNIRGRGRLLPTDLAGLDDLVGAADCTRHLLSLGRKRIGMVIASPTTTHDDRVAGYLFALYEAHSARRKPTDLAEVVIRQPTELPTKEAYAAVADAVVRERLDGVVCYSDYTALGLVMELLHRGVRVPKDVAVTGFDNLPIGDLFAIGLTTYDYPAEQMAEQAVRLMRDRVKGATHPPVRVSVPGELIIRGSTGATK
ncbi:MAG TPA: GntR family transcriptional regulator [Fimbriiglobus sp.]|nr:GntR family transcriptional regulator [Fimbriiglobus sp.]